MDVQVEIDMRKAERLLQQLTGPARLQAAAAALNDAAFVARTVIQQEMDRSFDKVTPYIRKSVWVDQATAAKPEAHVRLNYLGGKGADPDNVLRAQIHGGSRKHKRAERAFQRVGILQPGFYIVPGQACPLDVYGNIKGSFLVQLISYFQAFGEQGYKANMSAKRKAALAKKGRSEAGFRRINGVEYFATQGKLRGGHLAPGIYSRSGTHGVDIKPILMFVRQPSYEARLDFYGKPVKAAIERFNPRLRYHLRRHIEGLS